MNSKLKSLIWNFKLGKVDLESNINIFLSRQVIFFIIYLGVLISKGQIRGCTLVYFHFGGFRVWEEFGLLLNKLCTCKL